MSEEPKPSRVLKCAECGAKLLYEIIMPGRPIVCEYCGAKNIEPEPPREKKLHTLSTGRRRMGIRRGPHRAPLLRTVKLLADKGVIDPKVLQHYTKRNIDHKMRPPVALRHALRQMRDEDKLDREKIMTAVDELIAEQKLPKPARANISRLLK